MSEQGQHDATVWEHLEELVLRLRRIIISIIIMSVVMSLIPYTLDPYTPMAVVFPRLLLEDTIPKQIHVMGQTYEVKLAQFNPMAGFNILIASAVLLGFLASSPYIAYEIASYLSPALYSHEKRILRSLTIAALILFAAGIAFAYFIVLPWVFRFLFTTSVIVAGEEGLVAFADIEKLFWLAVKLIIATGVIFEIPLILYILLTSEIISIDKFKGDGMKYAFIASLIVGAIISPDPTGLGMLIIGIPYFMLIWVAVKLAERKLKSKHGGGKLTGGPGLGAGPDGV